MYKDLTIASEKLSSVHKKMVKQAEDNEDLLARINYLESKNEALEKLIQTKESTILKMSKGFLNSNVVVRRAVDEFSTLKSKYRMESSTRESLQHQLESALIEIETLKSASPNDDLGNLFRKLEEEVNKSARKFSIYLFGKKSKFMLYC